MAQDLVLRKLGRFMELREPEVVCLRRMLGDEHIVPAHASLIVEDEPYERIFALKQGWAFRYKLLPDGRRQILNFLLPGDLIGVRASVFRVADESVDALTDVTVASFPAARIADLFRQQLRLGMAVFWSSAREHAMLAEHVASIGRRTAYERLAHLFMELLVRLQAVGLADDRSYQLPLTQELLADALGLSIVHVNRTLRRLRTDSLLAIDGGQIVITDIDGMSEAASFANTYLHVEGAEADRNLPPAAS